MNTPGSTLNLLGDLWSTGNWWARQLLVGAVVWHLATLCVGLIGVPMITILFMTMTGSAITIAAIWYGQPLIPVLAAFTSPGRTAIHWIAIVIGLELALGIYLATVPVGLNWTTRGLALLAIGAALAAIVLKLSGAVKLVSGILWLKFVVFTAIIYGYYLMPDLLPAFREGWFKEQAQAAERIRRGEPAFVEHTHGTSINYPVCDDAETIEFAPGQTKIKVPIKSHCWSGWIKLPTDANGRGLYTWWGTDSPGELEFAFPDGRRVLLKADKASYGWLPPGHRFRLRGPGIATVTIER